MSFTLLPAVDIAGGRVARGNGTIDPLDAALAWQAEGAEWIHLVDLDAAFGRGSNADLMDAIVGRLDVPVELAGGIEDVASLDRAVSTGCARVNLSTVALGDPTWCARVVAEHGDLVAVCLDVDVAQGEHRLRPRGSDTSQGDLWEALALLDAAGCARYVVTDVSRDGRMGGPNFDLLAEIGAATSAKVIASGGIASLADLRSLANGGRVEGAIVGAALLAGRFTLGDALAAVLAL